MLPRLRLAAHDKFGTVSVADSVRFMELHTRHHGKQMVDTPQQTPIHMAYDERLPTRIRRALSDRTDITERTMFGGLAFLCDGRMCCGLVGHDLMVRVPIDEFDAALRKRHVRPMDVIGKPLKGFVYVSRSGIATPTSLRDWLMRGERAATQAAARRNRQR
jgi:hypothetical protein